MIDENDDPLGPGEPGELCIQSSTLTLGYWKRPDLNVRAYLLREGLGPFPEVWFRTGDIVVLGEDGLLRFLGRRDRMVKTRGHRVELAEVEAALVTHPTVAEAAAYTVPDGRGSTSLRASVTLDAGSGIETEQLLRHLRDRLPPYAVPGRIRVVDDLPRTSSGKVDYRRLVDGEPVREVIES